MEATDPDKTTNPNESDEAKTTDPDKTTNTNEPDKANLETVNKEEVVNEKQDLVKCDNKEHKTQKSADQNTKISTTTFSGSSDHSGPMAQLIPV